MLCKLYEIPLFGISYGSSSEGLVEGFPCMLQVLEGYRIRDGTGGSICRRSQAFVGVFR